MLTASLITTAPFFASLFWTCVLGLESRRKHDTLLLMLTCFMAACTLLYLGHCVFFNRYYNLLPLTDTVYCTCNLLVFPLYYLYLRSLTVPHFLTDQRERRKGTFLMVLPALIVGTFIGLLYLSMDEAETTHFIDEYLYHDHLRTLNGKEFMMGVVHHAGKIFFMVQIVLILVYGYHNIRDYNRMLKNDYADIEDKKIYGVQFILVLFIVAAFMSFTSNMLGRFRFTENLWSLSIVSIFFSVLIFLLGYVGLVQEFSVRDIVRDQNEDVLDIEEEAWNEEQHDKPMVEEGEDVTTEIIDSTVESEPIPHEQMLGYRISQLMENEQLYLRHDLKIIDLAHRLRTNRTYIQRAIQDCEGCSFSEYINRLRIDFAEKMIEEHPEYAISVIAERSGYTNLSTFYRNFRIVKGRTPKEKGETQIY
ncbi:MAG: AraC family transcriptional regulator [Prevotella sp.]|nr:AraC family transcriptional regulator [Prevotella sp.]